MGKYLFFDIDGTLIGPSKRVTKNTEEGIKKARANGHKTFLCTGRAPVSIMKSIRDIGFDGIISSAGGFVSIDGKYIFENFINQYVLSEVMLLFTNAKILFSLETKDALYQTPGVQDFFEKKQANILEGNLELARFLEERRNEEVRLPISEFNKCGQVVLEGHIQHCVRDGIEHGDADKTIESFTKAVERFSNMS